MALYVPGVEETDPQKIIRSQQLIAGVTTTNTNNISANTTNIATNTTNIATNTTNIATNALAVSALQAGPLVSGAIAAKSDEVTATNITLATTPGRQQFHPSAAKAWVAWTGSTGAILASYGVTSVTRNSTGNYTVVFSTSFTSANYAVLAMSMATAGTNGHAELINGSQTVSQVVVGCVTYPPAVFDPTSVYLVCFGTQ